MLGFFDALMLCVSSESELEPLSDLRQRETQTSEIFGIMYLNSATQTSRFCSSIPGTRSRSPSTKMKNTGAPKAAFKVQPSSHSIIVNENLAQEKNNKCSFQSHFLKYTLRCCHPVSFHLLNSN